MHEEVSACLAPVLAMAVQCGSSVGRLYVLLSLWYFIVDKVGLSVSLHVDALLDCWMRAAT